MQNLRKIIYSKRKLRLSHPMLSHKQTEKNPIFKCDICDKVYKYPGDLTKHKKWIHHGQKYKCELCDQTFSQPQNRTQHIRRVHERVRFECTICKKSFANPGSLRV